MARTRAAYLIPLLCLLVYIARENLTGTTTSTLRIQPQQPSLSNGASSSEQGMPQRTASLSPPPPPPPPPAQSLAATYSSKPAAIELIPPAVQARAQAQPQPQSQPQIGQLQQPQQQQPQQPSQSAQQQLLQPPPTCTSLSCAGRFTKSEPEWAQLSFQPRIDWAAGGIRGDCVAGELEYIMGKYCSPIPRAGHWPSEDRLNRIDVHSQGRPKADLAEVVRLVPNRTILLMGDSVMEQFYNALQCFLRREGIELPNDEPFLQFVQRTAPLWRMGKRKKPPKLPQRAVGNTRLLYARVTTYQPDEVLAAIGTADVIVLNWGLHYQRMGEYGEDLGKALSVLNEHAAKRGNAVLFSETGAQHFKASDARGYTHGEWESRDKRSDAFCTCQPIEDFNVNARNKVLNDVLGTGRFPNVQVLPFYQLTRPRWRWHFGNCTHRPNGWNYETCCDCTHFCFSPAMWHAHLASVKAALLQSPGVGTKLASAM